jgi:hypothetical protein
MQFYIYRLERKGIGAKWSRGTCLAARKKEWDLIKCLLLEIFSKRL